MKTLICSIYSFVLPQKLKASISKMLAFMFNRQPRQEDIEFFKKQKAIFIHIPKAAGMAVYQGLFNKHSFGHYPIGRYLKGMSKRSFKSCFTFTIVRNPFDRIHSAYYYIKKGGMQHANDLWYQKQLQHINSFEEFVVEWLPKQDLIKYEHLIPQIEYVKHKETIVDLNVYWEI